jgi:hypothetical protein
MKRDVYLGVGTVFFSSRIRICNTNLKIGEGRNEEKYLKTEEREEGRG